MKLPPATLSVVIITRHRPTELERCLQSLTAQSVQAEIVVVDNSDDGRSEKLLKENFPSARYMRLPHTHFILATARNTGARQTQGDIIAFVDDDVTVYPGWVSACLEGYASPEIGAVGGRVLDPEVEHNDFLRDAPICTVTRNGGLTDNLECDTGRPIEVEHLRGCNLSARRDIFFELGGFDERAPIYRFEELDFCLRLRKAGRKIIFTPKMSVYHHLATAVGHELKERDWQKRARLCRSLMFIHSRAFGLAGWTIAARYLLLGDTGFRSFCRRPSIISLRYVLSGLKGKFLGLWSYWTFHDTKETLAGTGENRSATT